MSQKIKNWLFVLIGAIACFILLCIMAQCYALIEESVYNDIYNEEKIDIEQDDKIRFSN